MKVPPKRKGNPSCEGRPRDSCGCLNESPSEKEGKCANDGANGVTLGARLNESPSEKEGKYQVHTGCTTKTSGLNESPSEKEGKCYLKVTGDLVREASMKVPPKRKGNVFLLSSCGRRCRRLNESPSEKEGKLRSCPYGYGTAKCLNESPSEKEGKFRAQIHPA